MAKAVILAALLLAGCQTGGDFCLIEKPEYLTSEQIDALPPETARRILNRNEQGEKICGWKASI